MAKRLNLSIKVFFVNNKLKIITKNECLFTVIVATNIIFRNEYTKTEARPIIKDFLPSLQLHIVKPSAFVVKPLNAIKRDRLKIEIEGTG